MTDNGLPEGWALAPLGELGDWGSGGTPLKSRGEFYAGGTIPWLKIGDLTDGVVREAKDKITELGLKNSSAKVLPPGVLLLAMYGSIGKLGVTGLRCATNQAIAHCLPKIQLWYLFWALRWARDTLMALGKGGTQANISQTVLKDVLVPVAPLDEQHRIVAKVEELLAQVSTAREHLVKVPGILKRIRRSVLAAACSGKLTAEWRESHLHTKPADSLVCPEAASSTPTSSQHGEGIEIPESWTRARVDTLVSIQNGRAFPSKQYSQEGTRLLRPGNLHVAGSVEWADGNTVHLPISWLKECPEFILGSGELLMNLTAQSLRDEFLGRACIKGDREPALLNQRIARFRNLGTFDVRPYLFLYFRSKFFRAFVTGLDTGSLIRHMHSKDVARHEVFLPPPEEQEEIVRRVRELFGLVDAVEQRAATASRIMETIPQSILAKAFRGELVPTEAELAAKEGRDYESASVLLQQIQRETASDAATRRQRRDRASRGRSTASRRSGRSVGAGRAR